MHLSDSIRVISGVGPAVSAKLERLGIRTIKDLLYHIPFRYDDFRNTKTISELVADEQVTIRAAVVRITSFSSRKRNMRIVRATLTDDTGTIEASWFNQEYLVKTLKKNQLQFFTGKVKKIGSKLMLSNPSIERADTTTQLHSGRLVPIYPETEGLRSRLIRSLVAKTMDHTDIDDTMYAKKIMETFRLPTLTESLKHLHFPTDTTDVASYRRRLAFDEVVALLMQAKKEKDMRMQQKTLMQFSMTATQRAAFTKALPFSLSPSQLNAILDISFDLVQKYPALRLIQGEVGSGKTIVAAFALYAAAIHHTTGVLVAPTQVLAEQHFRTLNPIFSALGIHCTLVTAQNKLVEDVPTTQAAHSVEKTPIIIGTHAVFSHAKKLQPSIVVIDEEHRFGVQQRVVFSKAAKSKKPHVITMTATPIPRTAALTTLAHMDVSFLEEIPEKKREIETRVVDEKNRIKAMDWIRQRIEQKQEQVFVVCPFIQASEKESLASVKSAEAEFRRIVSLYPNQRVELIHGKVPQEQRANILQRMQQRTVDILVATPVIEVGIDIPHATTILIEGAERFGLAQLHQLRGRVGRSGQKGFCFLFQTPQEQKKGEEEENEVNIYETQRARLKKLETISNGNDLAELDLRTRGTGELTGVQQHGWGNMRFASWFDKTLVKECVKAVEMLSSSL